MDGPREKEKEMKTTATEPKTYSIAYVENGAFFIDYNFEAENDAEANAYAETNCDNDDWYVLDENGNNING
jgi:hypothetical protein